MHNNLRELTLGHEIFPRIRKNMEGFTLIESLVTITIIGILALVAIPLFVTQKSKAQDANAKSILDDSKKSLLAGSYGNISNYVSSYEAVNKMSASENNYSFQVGVISSSSSSKDNAGKNIINVYLTDGTQQADIDHPPTEAIISTKSESGHCVSLNINVENNEETWDVNKEEGDCGNNSTSTDTRGDTTPTPVEPPGVPIISQSTPEDVNTPSFSITVESGNSAKCKIGANGTYSSIASNGTTSLEYNVTSPLANDNYVIYCYQKSATNYSKVNNLGFIINVPETPTLSGVFMGGASTCATWSNNGVKCWGTNSDGEIGNGTSGSSHTTGVVSLTGVDGNVISTDHAWTYETPAGVYVGDMGYGCAITSTNKVYCWGDNTYGQLGDGKILSYSYSPVEVSIPGSGTITQISTAKYHACVVKGGNVYCWGWRGDGMNLVGDRVSSGYATPTQVLGGITNVIEVQTARFLTCVNALSNPSNTYGDVYCWGDPAILLTSPASQAFKLDYVDGVSTGYGSFYDKVAQVAVGSEFVCIRLDTEAVYCIGYNGGGIGNGSNYSGTWVQATGLASGVTDLKANLWGMCLIQNGGVKCWGDNTYGQVGDGTTTLRAAPVQVSGLPNGSGVTKLTSAWANSCIIIESTEEVKCWGNNTYGQLGTGDTTEHHSPVSINLTAP